MSNGDGMTLSSYADLKVANEVFTFKGLVWVPISIGYDGDPNLMIAKCIAQVPGTPAPTAPAEEEVVEYAKTSPTSKVKPKSTVTKKKGGGLDKAKSAMKRNIDLAKAEKARKAVEEASAVVSDKTASQVVAELEAEDAKVEKE